MKTNNQVIINVGAERETKKGIELVHDKGNGTQATFIAGPQGSGKSVLYKNIIKQLSEQEVPFIILDHIERYSGSHELKEVINPTKATWLDLTNLDDVESFKFCYSPQENESIYQKFDRCNKVSEKVIRFLDAVTPDTPMSCNCKKYLRAASLVVAYLDGTLEDTYTFLTQPTYRQECIDKVAPEFQELIRLDIQNLSQLTVTERGATTTNLRQIGGIIDRIDLARQSTYMHLMLTAKKEWSKPMHDCIKENKAFTVLFDRYAGVEETSQLVTYMLLQFVATLEDLSMQRHAIDKPIFVCIDEVFSKETALSEFIRAYRPILDRFNVHFIMTCHHHMHVKKIYRTYDMEQRAHLISLYADKDQDGFSRDYEILKEKLPRFQARYSCYNSNGQRCDMIGVLPKPE